MRTTFLFLLTPALLGAQVQIDRTSRPIGTVLMKQPPGAPPTEVRASATPTSIRLTWTCASGATSYEVRATPRGGTPAVIGTVTTQCTPQVAVYPTRDPRFPATQSGTAGTVVNGFVHAGLRPNVEYTYVVRALQPGGAYGDAPPITASTTPWPAPTGVTVSLADQHGTLRWQPVAGATSYVVLTQSKHTPVFTPLGQPTSQTTFLALGLVPGIEHRFRVQAVDGLPSTGVAVFVGTPANVQARFDAAKGAVVLRWEGTSYGAVTLLRSATQDGPWAQPAKVSIASETATDAQPLTGTSWYKLRVAYADGTVERPAIRMVVP